MSDKLTLQNGTVLNIESGSSLSSINMKHESKTAMIETWDMLTNENLKTVQVHNEDGTLIAEYADLVLVSETSKVNGDGTVSTSFQLRQKTETELLREEVEALKAIQQIQDGAITDLGTVVGEIAGGM